LGQNDAHPGGQLARLQALQTEGVARLVLADCLDECNRGDVVVVRPARGARRARTVWLERVAGDALTGDLRRWLRAGGPGRAAIPERLRQQIIDKRPA
jgi:hypothetical protein